MAAVSVQSAAGIPAQTTGVNYGGVGDVLSASGSSDMALFDGLNRASVMDLLLGKPRIHPTHLTNATEEVDSELRLRSFVDAWSGQSTRIQTILQRRIEDKDMWMMKYFPSQKLPLGATTVQISRMIFNDHLLDDVPELGTVRLVANRWEEWTVNTERKGLGMLIEDIYALTEIGIETYSRSIVQISNAIKDHFQLSAYYQLSLVQGDPRLPAPVAVGMRNARSYKDLFQHDAMWWAILNKSATGLGEMVNTVDKEMAKRGVGDSKVLVLPNNTLMTIREAGRNSGMYDYSKTGDRGVQQIINPLGTEPLQVISGHEIYESTLFPIGRRGQLIDPMLANRTIGEFFVCEHARAVNGVDYKQYKSCLRDVNVYNGDNDRIETITWKTGLRFSGLFKLDGTKSDPIGTTFFSGCGKNMWDYCNVLGAKNVGFLDHFAKVADQSGKDLAALWNDAKTAEYQSLADWPTSGKKMKKSHMYHTAGREMGKFTTAELNKLTEDVRKDPDTPPLVRDMLFTDKGTPTSASLVKMRALLEGIKDKKNPPKWVELLRRNYALHTENLKLLMATGAQSAEEDPAVEGFMMVLYEGGPDYPISYKSHGAHDHTVTGMDKKQREEYEKQGKRKYPLANARLPSAYAAAMGTAKNDVDRKAVDGLFRELQNYYSAADGNTSVKSVLTKEDVTAIAEASSSDAVVVTAQNLTPQGMGDKEAVGFGFAASGLVGRFSGTLQEMPLKRQAFEALYNADLPVPLDFTYARPFQRYRMGNMFAMPSNVGASYYSENNFQLSNDGTRKVMHGNLTIRTGVAVLRPEAVLVGQNVIAQEYLGGEGLKFFDPLNIEHLRRFKSGDIATGGITGGRSMFAIPRQPGDGFSGDYADMTGFFPDVTFAEASVMSTQSERPHMAMLPVLKQIWGYSSRAPYFENGVHPARLTGVNTLIMQGYQSMPRYVGNTIEQVGISLAGKGHWGDKVYNGCMAHRLGRDGGLLSPDRIRPQSLQSVGPCDP